MLCFPCLAIKTTLSVKIQNCSIFVAKSHIYNIFVAICSETLKTNRTEIFSPDLSSTKVPQPAHWWWWQPHCWWWRPPCRPPYLPPCRSPGPSGIKNFNPGIFRDGILPICLIPGFKGNLSGFSFLLFARQNWIFYLYHHHLLCTSATVLWNNPAVNNSVMMPITVLMCWKDFSPECGVICALSKRCQKPCIFHTNHN